MAWTASVVSKDLNSGVCVVQVRYTDGIKEFFETYKTQDPPPTWISDIVRDRMKPLNILSDYDVAVGAIIPSENPIIDERWITFQTKCRALITVKSLIEMGVVKEDDEKVLDLKKWVQDNFTECVDYLWKY